MKPYNYTASCTLLPALFSYERARPLPANERRMLKFPASDDAPVSLQVLHLLCQMTEKAPRVKINAQFCRARCCFTNLQTTHLFQRKFHYHTCPYFRVCRRSLPCAIGRPWSLQVSPFGCRISNLDVAHLIGSSTIRNGQENSQKCYWTSIAVRHLRHIKLILETACKASCHGCKAQDIWLVHRHQIHMGN